MAIRLYRPEDAPALAQLFYDSVRVLGPRRYSPEQVEAWAPAAPEPARVHSRCSDGRTVLVDEDRGGRIAGYADLEPDGHIDQFYLRPDFAGTGRAAGLLEALLTEARTRGMTELRVEASEVARGLFERHGFVVSIRRDFEHRGVPIWNWDMRLALK
jgi:putative acetyltransferase